MQGVAFSLRTLGQVNRRVPTVIYPLLSLLLFPCRVATWPLKFPNWTSSLNWMPQEKSRKKERVLASSVEWLFMSMDTRVTLHTYCIRVVFIVRFVFLLPLTAKMLSRVPFCFSTSQLLDGQKCFCQCIFSQLFFFKQKHDSKPTKQEIIQEGKETDKQTHYPSNKTKKKKSTVVIQKNGCKTSYSESKCIVGRSTWEINGRHFKSNLVTDPFSVYLIFSIFKKNITSQIHLPNEGERSFFQFKRISRRARREEWTKMFNLTCKKF